MSTRKFMLPVKLILSGSSQARKQKVFQIVKKEVGLDLEKAPNHPDFILLVPENSLGIAQVRELQDKLSFKPYQSLAKIAVIDQAEKLTIPAQNALLKTLEEPPAKTIIFLLAPQKESLLPTIISRCQLIQLAQKPQLEIEAQLVSDSFKTLLGVLDAKNGQRLKIAQGFSQRAEATKLIQNFLWLFREALLTKAGAKNNSLVKPLIRLEAGQIKSLCEAAQASLELLKTNANAQLVVDNLFLSLPFLGQNFS